MKMFIPHKENFQNKIYGIKTYIVFSWYLRILQKSQSFYLILTKLWVVVTQVPVLSHMYFSQQNFCPLLIDVHSRRGNCENTH